MLDGAPAVALSRAAHPASSSWLDLFGDDLAGQVALIACGGGMAVARDGRLLALLSPPVRGLSDRPWPMSGARSTPFGAQPPRWPTGCRHGAPSRPWSAPHWPVTPGPHVADLGICDGSNGEIRTAIVA